MLKETMGPNHCVIGHTMRLGPGIAAAQARLNPTGVQMTRLMNGLKP